MLFFFCKRTIESNFIWGAFRFKNLTRRKIVTRCIRAPASARFITSNGNLLIVGYFTPGTPLYSERNFTGTCANLYCANVAVKQEEGKQTSAFLRKQFAWRCKKRRRRWRRRNTEEPLGKRCPNWKRKDRNCMFKIYLKDGRRTKSNRSHIRFSSLRRS